MRLSIAAACVVVLTLAVVVAAVVEQESSGNDSRNSMVSAVRIRLPRSLRKVEHKLARYYRSYRKRIDKRASIYYEKIQKEAAKLKKLARDKFIRENLRELTRWRNKQQVRLNQFVKRKARQIGHQWKRHLKKKLHNKRKHKRLHRKSKQSETRRVRKELERTKQITRELTSSMKKHHRSFHKQSRSFERKLRIQHRRHSRHLHTRRRANREESERRHPQRRRSNRRDDRRSSRRSDRRSRQQEHRRSKRRERRQQKTEKPRKISQAAKQWWKRSRSEVYRRRRTVRRIAKKSESASESASVRRTSESARPLAAATAAAPAIASTTPNATANGTASTNKTVSPAAISRCIRVVQAQVCCQKNNVQPCCQQAQAQARQQHVRFIPPSNSNRPRWTPQTATWFSADRPNRCVSHACKMRFLHRRQAAAQEEEEEEEAENVQEEDAENSNEGAEEDDESVSESADDNEDFNDDFFLELDAASRTRVRGCVKVVQFCASAPSCASRLPPNMVTWLERKRASDVKADKVEPNANPRRTPSPWNYAKGGLDWTDGACSSGKLQSPIAIPEHQLNLTTNQNEYAGNAYQLRFNYQPIMNLTITHHHGYAISVKPNIAGALGHLNSGCCNSVRYHVIGFHFHAKSEHTFPTRNKDDGGHYPMEMHIMHQKEGSKGNDDLISVAIPFQLKRTPGNNKFLDSLNWNSLPKNIGDSAVLSSAVNLNDLEYSLNGDYFAYNGSLTTPGCPENVQYRVMSNPQSLPQSQLDALTSLIRNSPTEFPGGHGNYREIQPRNGRSIVLFKRHAFSSNAFQAHNRRFVWVRTERPSPGAVLKLD